MYGEQTMESQTQSHYVCHKLVQKTAFGLMTIYIIALVYQFYSGGKYLLTS